MLHVLLHIHGSTKFIPETQNVWIQVANCIFKISKLVLKETCNRLHYTFLKIIFELICSQLYFFTMSKINIKGLKMTLTPYLKVIRGADN